MSNQNQPCLACMNLALSYGGPVIKLNSGAAWVPVEMVNQYVSFVNCYEIIRLFLILRLLVGQ